MPVEQKWFTPDSGCRHNLKKGVSQDVTIPQIITCHLALPTSLCLGPQVSVRILTGLVGHEVERCIRAFSQHLRAEIVELNVQMDHVHLLAMAPPKISISEFVGALKGRTAIREFNQFRHLKHKPYWGNHF